MFRINLEQLIEKVTQTASGLREVKNSRKHAIKILTELSYQADEISFETKRLFVF